MDLGIRNKIALVTGAGGGLGGAISASLAREGVKVVLADIDQNALEEVKQRICASGGEAIAIPWDLADAECTIRNMTTVRERWGEVDILVNNTGGPPPTLAQGVKPEDWQKYFHSMVNSVIHLTDLVLPGMRSKGWGRIITSTSSGVVAPIPNLGISNTLRSALLGWSKTLSREVAPEGITANIILPGRIATARIEQLDKAKAQREGRELTDVIKASTDSIPVKRYGKPQEYGDAVAFLASQSASYITGSIIRVDGGLINSI